MSRVVLGGAPSAHHPAVSLSPMNSSRRARRAGGGSTALASSSNPWKTAAPFTLPFPSDPAVSSLIFTNVTVVAPTDDNPVATILKPVRCLCVLSSSSSLASAPSMMGCAYTPFTIGSKRPQAGCGEVARSDANSLKRSVIRVAGQGTRGVQASSSKRPMYWIKRSPRARVNLGAQHAFAKSKQPAQGHAHCQCNTNKPANFLRRCVP